MRFLALAVVVCLVGCSQTSDPDTEARITQMESRIEGLEKKQRADIARLNTTIQAVDSKRSILQSEIVSINTEVASNGEKISTLINSLTTVSQTVTNHIKKAVQRIDLLTDSIAAAVGVITDTVRGLAKHEHEIIELQFKDKILMAAINIKHPGTFKDGKDGKKKPKP